MEIIKVSDFSNKEVQVHDKTGVTPFLETTERGVVFPEGTKAAKVLLEDGDSVTLARLPDDTLFRLSVPKFRPKDIVDPNPETSVNIIRIDRARELILRLQSDVDLEDFSQLYFSNIIGPFEKAGIRKLDFSSPAVGSNRVEKRFEFRLPEDARGLRIDGDNGTSYSYTSEFGMWNIAALDLSAMDWPKPYPEMLESLDPLRLGLKALGVLEGDF